MSGSLHPELLRLGRQLESVGIVAAVHADHLCVRLPLLSSVRVRYDGERLSFDPRFGVLSRTKAVVGALGSVSALIVAITVSGTAVPVLVAAGSLGALAAAYDVMRFIVTESAIVRVTTLWAGTSAQRMESLGSGPAAPVNVHARAAAPAAPPSG